MIGNGYFLILQRHWDPRTLSRFGAFLPSNGLDDFVESGCDAGDSCAVITTIDPIQLRRYPTAPYSNKDGQRVGDNRRPGVEIDRVKFSLR